jgi:hypothetical protein
MSLLRNLLDKTRGQALSLAGKKILAAYLEKYGAMLNFSVNPETHTIGVEMLLKGEKEPIQLTLRGYEIVEPEGGKPALRIAQVSASREWLEVALRQFVEGKPIELPASAAALMKLLF